MARGKIKWFDKELNFGFIIPDDGSEDLFVHLTRLKNQSLKPEAGYVVEYTVGKKADKKFAADVTVISAIADTSAKRPHGRSNTRAQELDSADLFEQEWGLRRV